MAPKLPRFGAPRPSRGAPLDLTGRGRRSPPRDTQSTRRVRLPSSHADPAGAPSTQKPRSHGGLRQPHLGYGGRTSDSAVFGTLLEQRPRSAVLMAPRRRFIVLT